MRWIQLMWCAVLLGGCCARSNQGGTTYDPFSQELASGAPGRERDARAKLRENPPLVQRYGSIVFAPLCDGKRSAPATQRKEVEGVSFHQPCGTIFQGFTDQQFPSFAAVHCMGIGDDRCRAAARRMFVARLEERYTLADKTWIDQRCGAHSDECDEPSELEALYAGTHNAAALAELDRALSLRETEPEERLAAQRRAFLGSFAEAQPNRAGGI